MHGVTLYCIVMQEGLPWACEWRWPVPADTPAGNCCACWPGTPRSRSWGPRPHANPAHRVGRAGPPPTGGERVGAVHPHLGALGLTFGKTDATTLADADLVFLALPHG